jgi:hypothetical protein
MQAKVSNVLNACTLVGLGGVFLSFYWGGRIDQYLNPSFRPLVLIGGVLMAIIGVTRLLTSPAQHCCSEGDCDHRHVKSMFWSLASFGVICVSVLAGGTFSKDAFDQQIFTNRASIEDDRNLSGLHVSNAGFPANALRSVAPKNGLALGQDRQPLPALGAKDAESFRSSADGEIGLEVTDLLRAEQPLRSAIAGKECFGSGPIRSRFNQNKVQADENVYMVLCSRRAPDPC